MNRRDVVAVTFVSVAMGGFRQQHTIGTTLASTRKITPTVQVMTLRVFGGTG